MKVLLAIDDSPCSRAMIKTVAARRWPVGTEFKILTVVEKIAPHSSAAWKRLGQTARAKLDLAASEHCQATRHLLESHVPGSIVHFEIRHGQAQEEIITAAAQWSADKIVLGAHGKDICPRFMLGSVSRSVVSRAQCSVEIIRSEISPVVAGSRRQQSAEICGSH